MPVSEGDLPISKAKCSLIIEILKILQGDYTVKDMLLSDEMLPSFLNIKRKFIVENELKVKFMNNSRKIKLFNCKIDGEIN